MATPPADPHKLKLTGEPVLTATELARLLNLTSSERAKLFGFSRGRGRDWLHRLRVKRLVRYIDLHPDLHYSKSPSGRYLYATADVENHVRAIREFRTGRSTGPATLTPDLLKRAIEMRGHGMRKRAIASVLGVGRRELGRALAEIANGP